MNLLWKENTDHKKAGEDYPTQLMKDTNVVINYLAAFLLRFLLRTGFLVAFLAVVLRFLRRVVFFAVFLAVVLRFLRRVVFLAAFLAVFLRRVVLLAALRLVVFLAVFLRRVVFFAEEAAFFLLRFLAGMFCAP